MGRHMEGGNPAQEVYNASLEMAQPMAWMPWKAYKTRYKTHGQARRTESHPLLTTALLTVSFSGDTDRDCCTCYSSLSVSKDTAVYDYIEQNTHTHIHTYNMYITHQVAQPTDTLPVRQANDLHPPLRPVLQHAVHAACGAEDNTETYQDALFFYSMSISAANCQHILQMGRRHHARNSNC